MIFIECTNLNLVNVNVKEDLSAEVKVPNIVVVLIVACRHFIINVPIISCLYIYTSLYQYYPSTALSTTQRILEYWPQN